jgi:hypothetical protein
MLHKYNNKYKEIQLFIIYFFYIVQHYIIFYIIRRVLPIVVTLLSKGTPRMGKCQV